MNRRRFIKDTLLLAALATPVQVWKGTHSDKEVVYSTNDTLPTGQGLIDTNIHLFPYPFRELKYGDTGRLLAKLKKHNVTEAWAGSFYSLFHKNIDHINASLAEECRTKGEGMLIPFGTVNPVFPDWEEDLRRCHERHEMPGIRLYPGYHGYTLDNDHFVSLLQEASARKLLIQIAIDIQDERMQHPRVDVEAVDVTPLAEVLKDLPGARVQLINPFRHVRGERLKTMIEETDVRFEISNLDNTAAIELILKGEHPYVSSVPLPAERLLFGSHMPYFPLENGVFKFMESDLSQDEAEAIMYRNASELKEYT
ncbi:MAG: hypothetical protein JJU13_16490 [Balneolaceae bacterium]|nr:hypothetical protein [Balneolaceae bacterium]